MLSYRKCFVHFLAFVLSCIYYASTSRLEAVNLFDYMFDDEPDYVDPTEKNIITLQGNEDRLLKLSDDSDPISPVYSKPNSMYFSVGAAMVIPNGRSQINSNLFSRGATSPEDSSVIGIGYYDRVESLKLTSLPAPMNPVSLGAYAAIGKSFGFLRGEVSYVWNGNLSINSNRQYFQKQLRYWMSSLGTLAQENTGNYVVQDDFRVNVNVNSIFANIYCDILKDRSFAFPYVGSGVGYSSIQTTIPLASITNVYFRNQKPDIKLSYKLPKNTENNFAWNLGAGFIVKITENFELDIGYRFIQFGSFSSAKNGNYVIQNLSNKPAIILNASNSPSGTLLNSSSLPFDLPLPKQPIPATTPPKTLDPNSSQEGEFQEIYYVKPNKLNVNNVTLMIRYRF